MGRFLMRSPNISAITREQIGNLEPIGSQNPQRRNLNIAFIDQHGILVLVSRTTAAKQTQSLFTVVLDPVNLPWRNRDRVPYLHGRGLPIDGHLAGTVSDIVNLFGSDVVVGNGSGSRWHTSLCQTLILNFRIPVRQQFSDFRRVLGGKRRH